MKRLAWFLLCAIAFAQQPARTKRSVPTYSISGVAVNAVSGEAVQGASITAAPQAERGPDSPRLRARDDEDRSVFSGPDGSFSISGLAAGKYALSATRRGFGQQAYDQHEQFSTAIVVGPGKDPGNLVFRLQPDCSIAGHVIDEHNEPVMNAQVMLFREGMQNGKRGIFRAQNSPTADDGSYRFSHLRPGKFYVAVSAVPWYSQYGGMRAGMRFGARFNAAGNAPADPSTAAMLDMAYPLTLYPGVSDPARAEPLTLTPGQRETVDFNLVATPSVHVRITTLPADSGQNAVTASLAQPLFDSIELGMRGRNMTVNQGVTELTGITPGHYTLQVRSFGPDGGQRLAQREVDVAGDMEINAADLPAGVNVTGSLRFEGAAPEDPIRLALRRRTAQAVQLQVSAKGEISSEHPVAPDTYDLFLPINGYQMTSIAATGAKLKGQALQVGSDDVHLTVVAAKSSARVSGVVMKDDKPFAGAMVVLVPEDRERPLMFRRDQSDSDGSFTLAAVTPGKYTLIALENGWELEWGDPAVLKPYLDSGEPVQVVVDGRHEINPRLQPVAK